MDARQFRILASLGLLAIALYAARSANARLKMIDDGCDELRSIVVVQSGRVLAVPDEPSVLHESRGFPVFPDPPAACPDTAAAATAAFSSAMHDLGISVNWGPESGSPGNYCDSRSLSHCNPRVLSGDLATADQLRHVRDTWNAIVNSIAGQMPYGVASDMTVFERHALESSMHRRLHGNPQDILSTISPVPQE